MSVLVAVNRIEFPCANSSCKPPHCVSEHFSIQTYRKLLLSNREIKHDVTRQMAKASLPLMLLPFDRILKSILQKNWGEIIHSRQTQTCSVQRTNTKTMYQTADCRSGIFFSSREKQTSCFISLIGSLSNDDGDAEDNAW